MHERAREFTDPSPRSPRSAPATVRDIVLNYASPPPNDVAAVAATYRHASLTGTLEIFNDEPVESITDVNFPPALISAGSTLVRCFAGQIVGRHNVFATAFTPNVSPISPMPRFIVIPISMAYDGDAAKYIANLDGAF